ncbi:hypothetical protein C8Q76DRAFT_689106 [Earliella scabrosa]|nr:hypothetical protein C8Q76DRAFT_689106 [Earliella scabrosa]
MHLPPYTCSLAASRPPASHRRATFFCAPYALDVAAALAPDTSLLGNQLYLARVGRALIVRYLSLPPPPPPLLVASTVMPHEYVTATVKETFETILGTNRHTRKALRKQDIRTAFEAIDFHYEEPKRGSHYKIGPGTAEAKLKWGTVPITFAVHEAEASKVKIDRLNRDLRKTYGWDDSTFLLRGEGPVDDLAGDAIDAVLNSEHINVLYVKPIS